MWCIDTQDSLDGHRIYGPFKTEEEAGDYADEFCGGMDDWKVIPLYKPQSY